MSEVDRGKKLWDAAEAGDRKQCEEEIKLGADLEVRGWSDKTPLMIAAKNGHYDVVKFLVEMGSVVEARDWDAVSYTHLTLPTICSV